jgi:hypothetical protein
MVLLALTGCRSKRVIPDDTLAEIFHDAFVVNAYIGEERISLDSLQIYEPIFKRYGYTTEDVVYTVGNFSRRKSARLGEVVERAITQLDQESKYQAGKVVILDTIKNVAVRTFTRRIYRDSLIRAVKRADSTALRLEFYPVSKGEYTIKYSYTCKGQIKSYPRRAEFFFEDESGFRSGFSSVSLRESGNINRTVIARENGMRLVVKLGDLEFKEYTKVKGKKKKNKYPKDQSITIRDLTITHKMGEKDAIDSLFKKYVDIKVFADGFPFKKDSLTLSADTTRVSTSAPRND